jgi:hypothetical protein
MKFFSNFKIIIPVTISAIALIISIRSCDIANRSYNLNRQEYEIKREARLIINIKWPSYDYFVSPVFNVQIAFPYDSCKMCGGLKGPILLQITNTSDHSIAIDEIKIDYFNGVSFVSIPQWWGGLISPLTNNAAILPITLESYQPIQYLTQIPILIPYDVEKSICENEVDKNYLSLYIWRPDVVQICRYKVNSLEDLEIIQKKIEQLGFLLGFSDYKPEQRLFCSSSDFTTILRGQRTLEIQVKLTSGEIIRQAFDYLDVMKNQFEWQGPLKQPKFKPELR